LKARYSLIVLKVSLNYNQSITAQNIEHMQPKCAIREIVTNNVFKKFGTNFQNCITTSQVRTNCCL